MNGSPDLMNKIFTFTATVRTTLPIGTASQGASFAFNTNRTYHATYQNSVSECGFF